MAPQTAQTLRDRARRLRHLAAEIERSPVLSLDRHADAETWRGDRPYFCVSLLRTHLSRLHRDADDLRSQAFLFEQRAAELEHLTLAQAGHLR
jgi:hypothetical protein